MNHFKGVVVIVLISVMLSTKSVAKEIDCTSSHKSWEISLEDFLEYCKPSFCKCYAIDGNCDKWNNSLFDGLAMMWYQQNVDNGVNLCGSPTRPKKNDDHPITIKTDSTTQFLTVRRDQLTDYQEINLKTDRRQTFKIKVYPGQIRPHLNTKVLFDMKINVRPNYYSPPNYKPSSFRIINPKDPYFDTRIVGPFGGVGHSNRGWFQMNKYWSLKSGERVKEDRAEIEPILLTNAFLLRPNPVIELIGIKANLQMCLGRKINPQTKRTHWTGEGCVPKIYFPQPYPEPDKPKPVPNEEYNGNYQVLCECEFTSLGANTPDDPPDMKLDPDFNKFSNETIEPIPEQRTIHPSKATYLTSIVAIVSVVICLFLIVLAIGSVVYYKVLA